MNKALMLLMLGFLFMCLKWAGEFDPTNNIISGNVIVTAYGRDYSDISPLKELF
jgi:hypothetical protein